jgi:carboxyl-terminal processing protease
LSSTSQRNYYKRPDAKKVVEAPHRHDEFARRHSSYISANAYSNEEDTEGEFEGIGVSIQLNDAKILEVVNRYRIAHRGSRHPLGDVIYKIDGVSTKGMSIVDAAQRIKGPGGTMVHLSIIRHDPDKQEPEIPELDIKRGKSSPH